MGNKKRHINSEIQLLEAMRCTGYCFPTNDYEQNASLKIQEEIDIDMLADSIDSEDIWNADKAIDYKTNIVVRDISSKNNISEHWGIAAKGSANISKEIMDKIKRNQNNGNSK